MESRTTRKRLWGVMGAAARLLAYTRPVLSVLGTRTGGGGSAISSTFPVNTAVDIPAPTHGVLAGPAQEQPSRRTQNKRSASTTRTNTFSLIPTITAMMPRIVTWFAESERDLFLRNFVTGILRGLPENLRCLGISTRK
jgi:hypothetical protein